MTTQTKQRLIKLVVWDLDGTIWDGILAEGDDPQLRPGVRSVLETLDERGVLHSVASKNNFDDAWNHLQRFDIADYFLYPQIHWRPKSQSIAAIQEKFNIGFDAIAFIDDQEFERDEVAFAHDDVWCLGAEAVPGIVDRPEFRPRFITDESARRRDIYRAEFARNEAEDEFEHSVDFLKSLSMRLTITEASVEDLRRVEELTVRTNQLNATGYTYSYEDLEELLDSPHHKLFVGKLVDRYGSYGTIGVALIRCDETRWTLKLLLMSCRVMSRGVGTAFLHYIINLARSSGADLFAEFRPTDRNRIMNVTYQFAGFRHVGELESGGSLLKHDLEERYDYPAYLDLEAPAL